MIAGQSRHPTDRARPRDQRRCSGVAPVACGRVIVSPMSEGHGPPSSSFGVCRRVRDNERANGLTTATTLDCFDSPRTAFDIAGDAMRVHRGRSVVALNINGHTHYLKRYWLTWSKLFKRQVARGFHELRMADWLQANGFLGPRIVRRGQGALGPIRTRVFFLMEEVPDELPLEAAWNRRDDVQDGLMQSMASFAALLHDKGFVHTDFSERHILVGRLDGRWSFRLIDIERAEIGVKSEKRKAADIATLIASVMSRELREVLRAAFLDAYISHRSTLERTIDFRRLVDSAKPTKSFS